MIGLILVLVNTTFTTEFYAEPEGLDSLTVLCMAQHPEGDLWLGTYVGLSQFNGLDIRPLATPALSRVRRIVFGERTWLPTFNGLFVFENGQWTQMPDIDNVYDVLENAHGTWVATGKGLYLIEQGVANLFADQRGMACNKVLRLKAINDRQFWVGTECGLIRFDGVGFSLPLETEAIFGDGVYDIAQSAESTWFATTNGLVRSRHGETTKYDQSRGLPNNQVWCVTVDSRGWVWAGTDGGLALSKDHERFETVNPEQTLGFTTIYAITEEREGSMWLGTCTGLMHIPEPALREGSLNSGETTLPVMGFLKHSRHGLLVSTQRAVYIDDEIFVDEPYVRSMLEDEDASIWMASRSGLIHWTPDKLTRYGPVDGLENDHILHATWTPDHEILISTLAGAFVYQNGRINRLQGFDAHTRVHATLPQADKTYLATEEGLFIASARLPQARVLGPTVETYSLLDSRRHGLMVGNAQGLANFDLNQFHMLRDFKERIYGLAEDNNGTIWIALQSGLACWNGLQKTHVWPYQGQLEASLNAMWSDGDGVWFGHYRGYLEVDAANYSILTNPYYPNQLQVHRGAFKITAQMRVPTSSNPITIALNPGSLRFTKNYKIQLYDRDSGQWSTFQGSETTWPNTDIGQQQIAARALLPSGQTSEESKFEFTISPPFWRSVWFRSSLVIAFLILLARELRSLRTKNQLLALRTEHLTAEVARETAERLNKEAELKMLHSQMNPHFLQNAFNTAIAQLRRAPENTEKLLRGLAHLFRYHMQNRPDIWVTLKSECQLAQSFLAIQKIRFEDRLVYHIDLPPELESSKVPSFIIQPLLENAVMHGLNRTLGQLEVKLSFRKQSDLVIQVSNGGHEPLNSFPAKEGHALANIQKRLDILGQHSMTYQFEKGLHLFEVHIKEPI